MASGGSNDPRGPGFLLTAQGWPYLLVPFIPLAIALELAHASATRDLLHRGARDHPHGGADGPGDRGAGGAFRPGHRRAAQRHLRQRAGADHRAVRARRGPAGGGQGLDRRLDHRQRAARARRLDAGRGHRPREPDVQRHRRQRAVVDAAARRRGADDAGDLRARRGQGLAEPDRRAGRLRLHGREPLARGGDRPHRHLRRRSLLLAAHPPRPLQPAIRRAGGGGLRLERAALGADAVRSPGSRSG